MQLVSIGTELVRIVVGYSPPAADSPLQAGNTRDSAYTCTPTQQLNI